LAECGSNIPGASWLCYGFKERQENRQKRKERSFARGRQGEVNRDLEMESTSMASDDREIDHGIRGYVGWVYHVGTNSLGCQFCHARYLVIKGKHITMFKRNPIDYPQAVPIRMGVVGHHLMVEEVGRKTYHRRVWNLSAPEKHV
jgi:hypothetical protein